VSKFLRDEFLQNMSFTEDALSKVNECFQEIATIAKQGLDLSEKDQAALSRFLLQSYIIRFDNKGFRLNDFQEVLKHFRDARKVERFIFILQAVENITSSGTKGKGIELRLDANDPGNCLLMVQDDESEWVDSAFWKIRERLNRYRNRSYLVRTKATPMIVQLLGVTIGFMGSFWAAVKVAPVLAIENALGFVFIIFLLLFSNLWAYLYEWIINTINRLWPNVSFKEKRALHWLMQAIISAAFVGLCFAIVFKILERLSVFLHSILK